jgi:hypothetical protein
MTSRWRQAERRRLLAASERLARRRAWWAAQRDAASVRLAEIDAQLVDAAAKVAALEDETAETAG